MTKARCDKRDSKALLTIKVFLGNKVLREVKETTTKGIYGRTKLKSLYMENSVINRLLLKSRFYDLRLEKINFYSFILMNVL